MNEQRLRIALVQEETWMSEIFLLFFFAMWICGVGGVGGKRICL
jgi:hypothetical protein